RPAVPRVHVLLVPQAPPGQGRGGEGAAVQAGPAEGALGLRRRPSAAEGRAERRATPRGDDEALRGADGETVPEGRGDAEGVPPGGGDGAQRDGGGRGARQRGSAHNDGRRLPEQVTGRDGRLQRDNRAEPAG